MRKSQVGLIVFTLFGLLYTCTARDGRTSADAERTAERLRTKINNEIRSLKSHPWAGEYYEGNGLGVGKRLVLAPASGYVFEWHGCLGLYDRNYGTIVVTNDILHLSFTFTNVQEGFQGMDSAFIPIEWGDRRYLIPTNDIVEFCNSVNLGWEPRTGIHGFHFLRKGDERKLVGGLPKVPSGFENYFLKKPVTAKIIAVKHSSMRPSIASGEFRDTFVTLNAGAKQGLLPGMKLCATGLRTESLVLTKIEEDQSEGRITQMEEDPAPESGWVFSTRLQSEL